MADTVSIYRALFASAALFVVGSPCGCRKAVSLKEEPPARMLGIRDQERFRKSVLSSVKGVISIHAIAGDAEAARFADQLHALLQSCGFRIRERKTVQINGHVPPLVLIIREGENPPAHAAVLRAGFTAIDQAPSGEVWSDCPLAEVRVMVGPNKLAPP